MGRTRMLAAVVSLARRLGASVIEVPCEPAPLTEVGYTSLRALVSALLGQDPRTASFDEPRAALGQRTLFGLEPSSAASRKPEDMRGAVLAALRWSALRAVERAKGALVVVALDDVDRNDTLSLDVLGGLLRDEPVPGVLFVTTSKQLPAPHDAVRAMELPGLSRGEVLRVLGRVPQSARRRDGASSDAMRRIEPMYLDQAARMRAEAPDEEVPHGLLPVVQARLFALPPAHRRMLQATAVVGACTLAELVALTGRPEGAEDALRELEAAGFLDVHGGVMRLTHGLFVQVVLDTAPAGAIQQIHTRAADALVGKPYVLELRAFHAIRGRPDLEAFVLLDRTAVMRTSWGDEEGALSALSDGFMAARALTARGEAEATDALRAFGRKLAEVLVARGELDQAHGVLTEVLVSVAPRDPARTPILEQLAGVEHRRGRVEDARRLRAEIELLAAESPSGKRARPPVVDPRAEPPSTSSASTSSGVKRRPSLFARAVVDASLRPRSQGRAR
jgi:hypothetical protein